MEKITIYHPQSFNKFKCTTSECQETCCSNWCVEVDLPTYQKYKNFEDPEFKTIISNYFKKYNFFKSRKIAYGRFILNESKNCPFLDENKLCKIHLKHGEEKLSQVCNTFPRITNNVDGKLEQSLSIACSEAARIVLLDKSPFVISKFEKNKSEVPLVNRTFKSSQQYIKKFNTYAIAHRDLIISTLSNKDYELFEKLLILGDYFKDVSVLIYKKQLQNIPESISNFPNRISSEKVEELIKSTTPFENMGLIAINDIFNGLRINNDTSKNYMRYYDKICNGLGINENSTQQKTIAQYTELKTKYESVFEERFEYIIENYLINYAYTHLFPFIIYGGLFDAFIILATKYALLKFKLIGLYADNQNLTEEEFAYYIASFAKVYTHNNSFNLNIIKFFKSSKINNFQNLGGLIQI